MPSCELMSSEVPTALALAAADCPVWVWTSSRIDSPSSRFASAPTPSVAIRFFLPPNMRPADHSWGNVTGASHGAQDCSHSSGSHGQERSGPQDWWQYAG